MSSNTAASLPRALIVGNGLAGALLAVLFAKAGWRVSLHERRGDPRAKGYQGGRSINLALSARGLAGLAAAGLADRVRDRDLIAMPGRMIHPAKGPTLFQPYSHNPADAINSVSRGGLNLTLIEAAGELPNVEMHFDHLCVDADLTHTTATFQRSDGSRITHTADLIIGADGAFSALRGVMQKTDRFEYSQTYLGHGYKELHIPHAPSGAFALEPHALHIWPRGGSMMIALPNRDASFTCTLFWPFEGNHSFAALKNPGDIRAFFEQHYPDAVPLMPTLVHDFTHNPTSSLVTVRSWPWVRNKTVLVGDAAHAIVPFYGQGINCGFEDCVDLALRLTGLDPRTNPDALHAALDAYQHARKPNADAIAEMALANFVEMRDTVGRPDFLYRKKIEQTLHAAFPDRCQPQYNLVSFSTVPYTEAKLRGAELSGLIDAVVAKLPLGTLDPATPAWAERVREIGKALTTEAQRYRGETGIESARPSSASSPRLGVSVVSPLLDISPTISPTTNVWPGDTPFTREVLLDTEKGANITLSAVRTTVHLGSHADASNHYGTAAERAVGIDRMPLDHYLGPCQVAWASSPCLPHRLRPIDIANFDAINTPRVLLKTGTFPDFERWNADFAALSVELVEALAAKGVITIGLDTPSVDLQDSKDLPAHRAILRHRIAILEGLRLDHVAPGRYELIALPLKLKDADASPVRAVLRPLS